MDKWMLNGWLIQCFTELASASHRGPAWSSKFHPARCCLPLPGRRMSPRGHWNIERCTSSRSLNPVTASDPTFPDVVQVTSSISSACGRCFPDRTRCFPARKSSSQVFLERSLPWPALALTSPTSAGKPPKTKIFSGLTCPKSTRCCAFFFPKR